jgi:hypothetical protein
MTEPPRGNKIEVSPSAALEIEPFFWREPTGFPGEDCLTRPEMPWYNPTRLVYFEGAL